MLMTSCISDFVPEITEDKELLVVEGLITDQPGANSIKLSKSFPLGERINAKPLTGCTVTLSDDLGNMYSLKGNGAGTYITDSLNFRGVTGRLYTLDITVNDNNRVTHYQSYPMLMKPVPPIDSLYYEKIIIRKQVDDIEGIEECQIYLDTHDPDNSCRYYRWNYLETWKLRLPYDIPNHTCWRSENSKNIFIESTESLSTDELRRHPVTYISSITDRLNNRYNNRYSIIVNQYSLNEEEYMYWKKLQKLSELVGGLYDIIPSSITSNLTCVEDPGEKVLGYFSVSAVSSKRIFISEKFEGVFDPYKYSTCVSDSLIGGPDKIEGLGTTIWTLFDTPAVPFSSPRIRIFTEIRGCADCTLRGTNIKPDFWTDDK